MIDEHICYYQSRQVKRYRKYQKDLGKSGEKKLDASKLPELVRGYFIFHNW